ncbi:MAG: response regulator [Candidatus Hodarchaeota archaeon]
MNPLILVVEDNPEILFNVELGLKFNKYQVITTKNGEEALKVLSEIDTPPDLIISDIMMPKMDGYEFFKRVMDNSVWSQIPFIFLTAKSSPDDVRFGKLLGVDDYITKPFEIEDLIASVSGKLVRLNKSRSLSQNLEEKLTALDMNTSPSLAPEDRREVLLLWLLWDEKIGPLMKEFFPKDQKYPFSLEKIGAQLFHATVSIYGYQDYSQAQGILLNIHNINRTGYIFFDAFPDEKVRGGHRQFMLVVIAPKINYLESLEIKEQFNSIALSIKKASKWDIQSYWEQISEILSKPLV